MCIHGLVDGQVHMPVKNEKQGSLLSKPTSPVNTPCWTLGLTLTSRPSRITWANIGTVFHHKQVSKVESYVLECSMLLLRFGCTTGVCPTGSDAAAVSGQRNGSRHNMILSTVRCFHVGYVCDALGGFVFPAGSRQYRNQ